MGKSELYNWQNFVDGLQEYGNNSEEDMLLEMRQSIIDKLQSDIKSVESGKNLTLAFNDIFGDPTPENPKTRMIIPFGNPDIQKMKILMLDIFDKLYAQYNNDPNVRYTQAIEWKNKKEIVQQKRKPQGWVEGDPIPTVEKEVGSPYVTVIYYSKLGDKDKPRSVDISFAKLLQKYFPQEMEWWQGNKSKNISGKQSFFTSNVETMDQIIHEVKYGNEEEIRNAPVQDKIILFSRHPIDVVRMSDFSGIRSCHSQGGDYFKCAINEAKLESGGGAILYLVDKQEFDKQFPDGVIPQTDDLFNDSERGITDKLKVGATARLRVRRVEDVQNDVEYAVPDSKIYGSATDAFRNEVYSYFANNQINKFVEQIEGQKVPTFPNYDDLRRFGGSYEDYGINSVGSNFSTLIKKVYEQAGIYEKVKTDERFIELTKLASKYSFDWRGDDEDEIEEDFCEIVENEIQESVDRQKRILKYFKLIDPSVECDRIDRSYYIYGLQAFVMIDIPISFFNSDVSANKINQALMDHDYDDYQGDYSLEWPNMVIDKETSFETNKHNDQYRIFITYNSEASEKDSMIGDLRDLAEFENKVSFEDFSDEVKYILKNAGLLLASDTFSTPDTKERIDQLVYTIKQQEEDEDFPFEVVKKTLNKVVFSYEKVLFYLNESDLKTSQLSANRYQWPGDIGTEKMVRYFRDIMEDKVSAALDAIEKQEPLFKNIKTKVSPKYILPKLYSAKYEIFIKDVSYGNIQRYKVGIKFKLEITINNTLPDDQLLLSVQFMELLLEEPVAIEQIAAQAAKKALFDSGYLAERKNTHSSKLIKEGMGQNKNWRIKIRK